MEVPRPSPNPEPELLLGEKKKRKVPIHRRILEWYLKLRLLNKIAVWVLLTSPLIAVAGYKGLKPIYKSWQQRNALALAAACIAKNDDKGATLAFRRAVMANPKNPEVWRKIADFLELRRSPERLWIWERLTQLDPSATEYRLRAARAAVDMGDWDRANTHLEAISASARTSADYVLVRSDALLLKGSTPDARELLTNFLTQHPNDERVQLELYELGLQSTDPSERIAAEIHLRELARGNGPNSTEALRQLTYASAKAGRNELAASDAKELADRTDATVEDRLLFLEMEFATNSFTLPLSIKKTLDLAGKSPPADQRAILNYLVRRGLAKQAIEWLETQPASFLATQDALQSHIDLAIATYDWDKTYALLAKLDPPVPQEVLQKLRATQQAQSREADSEALDSWQDALAAARNDISLLTVMIQLSSAWNWAEGRERVLWTMSEKVPNNPLIWKELLTINVRSGDAPQLLRILAALMALEPANRQYRISWLNLQFLLNKGDSQNLLAMAEADANDFRDTDTQLVYAVYLADAGRTEEALKVADAMPESVRTSPESAVYLSYVYAKARKPAIVKSILAPISLDDHRLIPEERALAERALAIAEDRPENQISKPLQKDNEQSAALLNRLRQERGKEEADSRNLMNQLKNQGVKSQEAERLLERLRSEIEAQPSPPRLSPKATQ